MRARCVMRGKVADLVVQQATNFPAECNQPHPLPRTQPYDFPGCLLHQIFECSLPQNPNPMIFPIPIIIECLKSTPVLFRTSQQSLIQKQGENSADPFSPNHLPKSPASLIFVLAVINII